MWRRDAHQGDLPRALIKQGVSSFIIHTGVPLRYVRLTGYWSTGISNPGRSSGRLERRQRGG